MINSKKFIYTFFVMLSLVFLVYSPIANAQNWAALPPYNTLWPLWSPALSPLDSITGLPMPVVSSLYANTILPVQPGLTWDPSASNPWLLYNTPLGMAYYDPIGGVNMWPPSYLLDASGSPAPLGLPTDYAFLPPTPSSWLTANVPIANGSALLYLMSIGAPIFPTTTTIGPVATPIFGPLATPIFGPLFPPIPGIPGLPGIPIIGGVPLFLSASALLP